MPVEEDPRKAKAHLAIRSVTPARLEATRQEVEVHRQKTSSSAPLLPDSETYPASERSTKLDLIQDVQLILVDKYRSGTKVLWGAVGLLLLSAAGLAYLYSRIANIQDQQAQLLVQQGQLIEHGHKIEKAADETNQKIDSTNQKLDETQQKVTQAVDDAPKIEIDASGKAKVVLPVKTSEPVAKPKHLVAPVPSSSMSATPSSTPLPPQVPVEMQRL